MIHRVVVCCVRCARPFYEGDVVALDARGRARCVADARCVPPDGAEEAPSLPGSEITVTQAGLALALSRIADAMEAFVMEYASKPVS